MPKIVRRDEPNLYGASFERSGQICARPSRSPIGTGISQMPSPGLERSVRRRRSGRSGTSHILRLPGVRARRWLPYTVTGDRRFEGKVIRGYVSDHVLRLPADTSGALHIYVIAVREPATYHQSKIGR